MHAQGAVLTRPSMIRPGDKVALGRGPWAVVEEVRPSRGRPPKAGPTLTIVTGRGERVVDADGFVRVVRR